ncbi:hypothetical protein B0H67DRAFT_642099 [Lasiosphaeris hirsuta]|uniref:Histone-lysine N-methyltransferase ASH1L n=1 Tax=Lasiosphaeris hirsuta TaxID=260670 RepID=A0AA40B169_9PEZI|nr:hypothetical protein B0H67DRAFT_642099 [Lasiosphaeris hirsuta]
MAMATATEVTMAELAVLSPESSFSAAPTDASSNAASFSSTPPTTVSPDSMSLASDPDVPKQDTITAPLLAAAIPLLENISEAELQESGQQNPAGQAIVVAEAPLSTEPLTAGRARRARASLPVYNLSKLSGTAKNGKRRDNGDPVQDKRRRTISGDTLVDNSEEGAGESTDALVWENEVVEEGIDASNLGGSVSGPSNNPPGGRIAKRPKSARGSAQITRRATRLSGAPVETLATKISSLGKRGRKTFEKGISRISRELLRLQDTNEFAHIETRPVRYTVWSNGKYIDPSELEEKEAQSPPRKKAKTGDQGPAAGAAEDKNVTEEAEKRETEAPALQKRRVKKWLNKGLYAGQEAPLDIYKGLTAQEKKKLSTLPELLPTGKPNKTLPAPIFNGLRMLIHGRDFKLPFDVCNPLPPGQPKPAAYRTMTKNRFVGDAGAYWKKTPHFEDFASRCVCKPDDGCAEDCQNRIMLYECDETNCNVGKTHCQNRAFQNLQARTKKGGRYRVGVEVYKTSDRGYGVRSNRCFEPNQIIMEYTGEIITEEECERRMNEVYKNNECYYLMSFDQNMIIDATTGSIARFVNHSCSPNCRMIKWIVSGQPRMALFAGDRPIMTGEELTYDYNFDPFSAKNVQKCLCGSPNCRGVLGPKPKEVKPPKPPKDEKKGVKGSVKAGKRKLKELLSGDRDDEDDSKTIKKRKIKAATGAISKKTAGIMAAKGAAKGAASAIKRSVSAVSITAKSKLTGVSSKKTAGRVSLQAARKTPTKAKTASGTLSSSSSLTTIVAAATVKPAKPTPKKKAAPSAKSTPKSTPASAKAASSRKRVPSRKMLEATDDSPAAQDEEDVTAEASAEKPKSAAKKVSPKAKAAAKTTQTKMTPWLIKTPALKVPKSTPPSSAKSNKSRNGLELSRKANVRLVQRSPSKVQEVYDGPN